MFWSGWYESLSSKEVSWNLGSIPKLRNSFSIDGDGTTKITWRRYSFLFPRNSNTSWNTVFRISEIMIFPAPSSRHNPRSGITTRLKSFSQAFSRAWLIPFFISETFIKSSSGRKIKFAAGDKNPWLIFSCLVEHSLYGVSFSDSRNLPHRVFRFNPGCNGV